MKDFKYVFGPALLLKKTILILRAQMSLGYDTARVGPHINSLR